jgi:hypothetical protein
LAVSLAGKKQQGCQQSAIARNWQPAVGTRNRRGATAVKSQQVSGYPDRLVFCLSERAT